MENYPVERLNSQTQNVLAERTWQYAIDPVRFYLDQAGKTPLLTKEEEFNTAVRVIGGQQARAELDALEQLNDLERTEPGLNQEHLSNLRSLVQDGEVAREHMIKSNLRLVVSIAKKYDHKTGSMELLDLIAEGNIGLFRAVDKFDPNKGFKFSTYATWWIKQSIGRSLVSDRGGIRIPINIAPHIKQVEKWESEYFLARGRLPTEAEACKELGLDVKRLRSLRQAIQTTKAPRELNKTVGDSDVSLIDTVADEDSETNYRLSETKLALQRMMGEMATSGALSEQDLAILEMHYYKNKTMAQIADQFGITREGARLREEGALRKIRNHMLGTIPVPYSDTTGGSRKARERERDRSTKDALRRARDEFAS